LQRQVVFRDKKRQLVFVNYHWMFYSRLKATSRRVIIAEEINVTGLGNV